VRPVRASASLGTFKVSRKRRSVKEVMRVRIRGYVDDGTCPLGAITDPWRVDLHVQFDWKRRETFSGNDLDKRVRGRLQPLRGVAVQARKSGTARGSAR
jgi:hypothetical protein